MKNGVITSNIPPLSIGDVVEIKTAWFENYKVSRGGQDFIVPKVNVEVIENMEFTGTWNVTNAPERETPLFDLDKMIKWKPHKLVKKEFVKAVNAIINPCLEPDWRLRNIIRSQENLKKLSECGVLTEWFESIHNEDLFILGRPVVIDKDNDTFKVGCKTFDTDAILNLIDLGMTSITFGTDKKVYRNTLEELRDYLQENR